MKATVEPALLADVLFSNGVIDPNRHHDLRNDSISNKEKWERLSTEVEDPRDIIEVLRLKYPMVYEEFDMANAPSFICWCDLIITRPKPAISSCEDASDEDMDVANLADLESVLEEADEEAQDNKCVSATSRSELRDLPEVRQQSGPSEGKLWTRNVKEALNDHMDDQGTASESQNKRVGETPRETSSDDGEEMEITYARDSTTVSKNKGFRQTIKTFLDKHLYSRFTSRVSRHTLPTRNYSYDAFIMHAYDDFFSLKNSILKIERLHNLKLCIFERDFRPGDLIVDNIKWALLESRTCVAVLSHAFFESDWCMYEHNLAASIDAEQGCSKLVLVKDGDLSIQRDAPKSLQWQLREGAYIDFNKHDQTTFVRDLAKAIKDKTAQQ